MKYITKSSSLLNLNNNELTYPYSQIKPSMPLPIEVAILSELTIYTSEGQSFIDHCPETLGYYWVGNDECLRTTKGLVFKLVDKKEAIQTSVTDLKVIYQAIDEEKSVRPTDEVSYKIERVSNLKGTLHLSDSGEYFLQRGEQHLAIYIDELELTYEYDYECGYELIDETIIYYNRELIDVDIPSFKVLNCNYAIDKNHAFCGDTVLENADLATFEVFTHSLAKDKNQVYHFSKMKSNVDADSLQLLGNRPESLFYRDKNHIFEGDHILIDADLESFEVLNETFCRDKNYIYRMSRRLSHVDRDSFEIISDDFFKDKHFIYRQWFEDKRVCESHPSFESLDFNYFKLKGEIYFHTDEQHVCGAVDFELLSVSWCRNADTLFYKGQKVYQGDVSDVVILTEIYVKVDGRVFYAIHEMKSVHFDTFEWLCLDFARDRNSVYDAGEVLENSDPATFEQIDTYTFIDKQNVYFIDQHYGMVTQLENIDTEGVELVDGSYLKTKSTVFYEDKLLFGADPKTFEVLQGRFAKDKNAVYNYDTKLEALNVDTLRELNYQFICDDKTAYQYREQLDLVGKDCVLLEGEIIKDLHKVYYKDNLIEGVDAPTYEVLNNFFQKDKNGIYHYSDHLDLYLLTTRIEDETYAVDNFKAYFLGTEIEGIDITSFEVLEDNFSKDKHHVYRKETKIEGVDVASFEVVGYGSYQDKDNVYTIKQGEFVFDRKRDISE